MSDAVLDRRAALWKARQRALSLLSQRHPEEFLEIKNTLLRRWGYDPIDTRHAGRTPVLTEDSPQH